MAKKKSLLTILSIGAASLMLLASLTACGGSGGASSSSGGSDSGSGYSTIEDGKASAQKNISAYEKGKSAAMFSFADTAYKKAQDAGGRVSKDSSEEDVEKAAKDLGLERLTVTDESGEIVVSYPKGDEGKHIKEISELAIFNKVVKGISDKYMKDPEYNAEEKTYSVLAGVRKGDEGGVVVVGYNDAGYAAVIGSDIAEKCGDNTVVLTEDRVIGSTLKGIEIGSTLEEIGVKKDDLTKDSFTLKAGDKSYTAAAVTKGDLTVIAAVPA